MTMMTAMMVINRKKFKEMNCLCSENFAMPLAECW
jgi:hypothetical protein